MKHVLDVLTEMGLEVEEESQYKFRCIRPKKRKIGSTGVSLKDSQGGSGLAAFSMVGSAASGGVSIYNNSLPFGGMSPDYLRVCARRLISVDCPCPRPEECSKDC